MARLMPILGVLVAVVALTTLSPSSGGALAEETVQGYFVAEIEGEETASFDGEQLGPSVLAVGTLPPLVCPFAKYNGEATTLGPVSTNVTLNPAYELCHTIIPSLGTRTVTVTMNGCTFDVEATTTVTEGGEEHFLGDPDIECPSGKQIEVHVYNTASSNDTGAPTLCTYDIQPQSDLTGITFTNLHNEPTAVDDVIADFNVASIDVTRTGGTEGICGPISQTAAYQGQATFRATSDAGEFVAAEVANKKRFLFEGGAKALTFKGENGNAKLTTEKGAIECAKVKYEGTPANAQPDELTIKPTYSECKFDNLTAHVEFNECTYTQKLSENFTRTVAKKPERHTTGPMEIVCPKDKSIKVKVTKKGTNEVECTFTFGAQAPGGVVDLKNLAAAKRSVLFTNTVTKVAYEVEGNATTCGKNGEKLTNGALDGEIDVKAYSEAAQIHLQVIGIVAPECPK